MQKVRIAYLQAPTRIGPYTAITTVEKKTMPTATDISRLDDGSLAISIDDVIYIISAANVKIMAVENKDKPVEIKRK